MPDIHVSMLALHVPNVLPKYVPWIDFARHQGLYINHHSQWVRHAGRMIWWTLIFAIGIVIAFVLDEEAEAGRARHLGADNSRARWACG